MQTQDNQNQPKKNQDPFAVMLNNADSSPQNQDLFAFSILPENLNELENEEAQSSPVKDKIKNVFNIAKGLLHVLFIGTENEQRPNKSTWEIIKEIIKNKGQLPETVKDQGPSGLLEALDTPLYGLTTDDIQFANEVDAAIARRPRFGARTLSITVAIMFLFLIIWAAFADIDEVTHADGSVVGSQRTQTIQNLEGGILRSILVHEGQIVNKGDILAQLDNEMAESSYRDSINKAMENSLAIIRLEAELKGEKPVFPTAFESWASQLIGQKIDKNIESRAKQIIQDQLATFETRKHQLATDLKVLQSQYEQKKHEVDEQTAHKAQLNRSLSIAIEQRDAAEPLVKRRTYSKMEFLTLEQKVVEINGQIDVVAASLPKAQQALAEAEQRIASKKAEQKSLITEEINKRRLELASLKETLSAGSDRVTRTELKSQVRGTVKQIYINSVGGVVKPGEPIMDIVPLDDTLLVEAKVSPKDVAFLRPGQDVMVKISAYDFSIYGGLEGKLESISADTIEDKKGDYHYLVKVRTQKTNIHYQNEVLPIIPGMLVTADILIGKKTVLDYLLKPILKAKQNALRER